jgi:hypothetical protein
LTTLLPNQNVVGYKWIFKLNFNANGTIAKYKEKLVAKGILNNNKKNIDYLETFSLVVKLTSI